ncbi:hypothetical protein BFN03_01290 [Rhodococcus sp. WMMA185]|nr:hypothetical protein BFN03_01290 [Rhodococcus sp. WMMA185]
MRGLSTRIGGGAIDVARTRDGRQYVEDAGQPRYRLDSRIPLTPAAANLQRAESPFSLAPQHVDVRWDRLGECHHPTIANPASDLEVGREHDSRTDGTEQFEVRILRGRSRLETEIDVDVRTNPAADGHDGRGLLQVEQDELLAPMFAPHHADRAEIPLLGQRRAVELSGQPLFDVPVGVALSLGPDLPHTTGLITTRPIEIQERTRAHECDERQHEPRYGHHWCSA